MSDEGILMKIESICSRLDCTGCGICKYVCPRNAIEMREDAEGFVYPEISDSCVACGLCVKRCPSNYETPRNEAEFYMGWHRDPVVLKASSSGGAFTAIAKYALDRGGIVYGVAKENDGRLRHCAVEHVENLDSIRRSKYYQSDASGVYADVENAILQGRQVVFSGTACQIAALKSALNHREHDNLITIDVLCHGVTSRKTIEGFIASKRAEFDQDVIDYEFRVKDDVLGWYGGNGTRVSLLLADGTTHIAEKDEDTFFMGFNSNFFLRESCYRCKYCCTDRISDFTLADYWGCKYPEVAEEQLRLGVSLILASTKKACDVLQKIDKDLIYYPINPANAVAHNMALVKPQARPLIRSSFFWWMHRVGYDRLVKWLTFWLWLRGGTMSRLRRLLLR